MDNKTIQHLKELESESIYVLREVAAQFERPVILFSGGKDSIVCTYLAYKAFYPAKIPFPLLHIDTGHNFQETLDYRDALVKKLGLELIVGSVQESIDTGRVKEETGYYASRNKLQITTLLDTIDKYKFDAAIGGARRDEEKARAKERFFSHRDEFGQWNPKNQRPELWNIFNGRKTWESTSASSPSPTGPRWMCGNISTKRTFPCQASTSLTSVRYSRETDSGWLLFPSSSASPQSKS